MRLDWRTVTPPLLSLAALVLGAAALLAGAGTAADWLWGAAGVGAAVPLVVGFVESLRKREWGLDVIAVLAIAGAVALGEFLTAAIVGLMLTTGEALDRYAAGRAKRELTALLQRAPRDAHIATDGRITTVPIGEVGVGDHLVVKPGEVIPVDGAVIEGSAVVDESSLTGEAAPVTRALGDHVSSGTVNAGDTFRIAATATAEHSTYAGIVRLVEAAQESKAPASRLADRYAAGFVPLALTIAGIAWLMSGDPIRALAVLVVATPCPLLLAVPIAIVSGVSRAARRGVVIKGGAVLERLASADIVVVDKTGTLTAGQATVSTVTSFVPEHNGDELLRLGASLDQMSNHVLAAALVTAARERHLTLELPTDVQEEPGKGIAGRVGGAAVAVGSSKWITSGRAIPDDVAVRRQRSGKRPSITVWIAVDGVVAGAFDLTDEVRPDTPRTIRSLRRQGIHTVIMATGDHPVVAEAVGAAIGADRVLSQCTPEGKVEAVRQATELGTVVMVGDGINDAPALAGADVGVAMGARGATSSSEAADVVLVVDRLDRLADAIAIAKRSRSIAAQSALLGMGLSLFAMAIAAVGWLRPVFGALLQEGVDVLAIVSALRALTDGQLWRAGPKLSPELSARLKAEHVRLMPRLDDIGAVADRLPHLDPDDVISELSRIDSFLQDELLPHEVEDDREIYPVLAEMLGGEDPMATMSMSHTEIFRLSQLYHQLVNDLADADPADYDLFDVRRVMYGLDAVLRLHFAQEEELYQSLDDDYHDRVRSQPVATTG